MIGRAAMETFLEMIIDILNHLDSVSLGLVNILTERRIISFFAVVFACLLLSDNFLVSVLKSTSPLY